MYFKNSKISNKDAETQDRAWKEVREELEIDGKLHIGLLLHVRG